MSIVERYIIQCPFLGGSSLRGSTVNVLFEDPLMFFRDEGNMGDMVNLLKHTS